ncbi:hypothetical protein ACJROX_06655 [Pseudalkalibacillus sp. A8]|uniref:hypothetical protein n=1 Tax=Pseudalkalibacillus sp. A8 TaxID=3382641 RepID=UPI0038B60B7C
MDPVFMIEYGLLFGAFGLYQVWAFLNRKSLKAKLLPMFIICGIGIGLSIFVHWYIFMFVAVMIEALLFVTMAVLLIEILIEFKKAEKTSRVWKLAILEILLILLYFWVRRII